MENSSFYHLLPKLLSTMGNPSGHRESVGGGLSRLEVGAEGGLSTLTEGPHRLHLINNKPDARTQPASTSVTR